MNSETPLIITGMHRSGTSLVARFIHNSGIDLGDELVGAKKSNPYGHFEDAEILEFQQSIMLREFGHPMWVPRSPATNETDRANALELAAARRHKARWGWKEPRTCLFLDFWNKLLPDARYLFVVRHPLLVLDSLSRRTQTRFYHFWKHNTYLKAWLVYNQMCFQFYQTYPDRCLLTLLGQVLRTPETFVKLLSNWLDFDFEIGTFQSLYDPSALTQKKSRYLLFSPVLRSKCLSLYDNLKGTVGK